MLFNSIREVKYFTNNKDFYDLYVEGLLDSQGEDWGILFLVDGDTTYVGDIEAGESLILQLGRKDPGFTELTLDNYKENSSFLEKDLFEFLEDFEVLYQEENFIDIDIYLTNGEILRFKGVELVEDGADELIFNSLDGTKKVFLLDNIAGYSIGES